MKISTRLILTTLSLGFILVASPSYAQISYLQLQPDGTNRLRQMNPDGGGDVAVSLPFPGMEYPTWSRDASLLAVTVPDPSHSFDKTQNVFAISSATGAVTKLTNYREEAGQGSLHYVLPTHKAFSPDRAALVTFSLNATGPIGGGVNTFPVLEIHPANGPGNALILGTGSSGNHIHEGEGVDWAPNRNVLVTPLQTTAPNLGGAGTSTVTALFFVDPSDGALIFGRFQQITFPRADINLGSSQWAEHDYQPKFSPNGVGLAYVRSFQVQGLMDLTNPTPWAQSIHILNLNTGADTELIAFQPGFYVSSLSWSPDGTQLAFDIGVQAFSVIGIPLKQAKPETNQIYVINTNGTGLLQLRGNGNSSPAFGPRIQTGGGPSALGNISTRMRVGNGENAMIGGFIITGSEPKKVLIRGMGPSLSQVGVPGVLTNPILNLFQGNTQIAANDDWQQGTNPNEIPNGFAPTDAREALLLATLSPGNYTAILSGAGGETGNGVVEIYDLSLGGNSRLANISTRGFVDTGDNAMFGGLIVTGGSSRVMLRAMGPSLQNAGIANPLQNPTLELVNGNGVSITSNDDWQQAPNTEEIPGGFAPSDGRESVIVTTLPAGNYTAIVRGQGNTTGVALVEGYGL